MINQDRLIKTFCDLVKIDSPSGHEEEISKDLNTRLTKLGFQVSLDSYGNLIASEGGHNPFMLSAHMDTVEPGTGIIPKIESDRIISTSKTILGGDCKAGISAILEALESLKEDSSERIPVEVVFTREEELGLQGAANLDFSKINSKEAIVFDGEGAPNEIITISPTYFSFDITIEGRAAHAGVDPENGISSIHIAAELISKLPQGRLDHETTFNIGTIKGGNVRNSVPKDTIINGEFRSPNIETLDGLKMQVLEAVNQVKTKYKEANVENEIYTNFHAYKIENDNPLALRIASAIQSLGLKPKTKYSGGGSDANIFREKGINSVVVGMADHNMHTLSEYVTISELISAAKLCEILIKK
mgnify:FL=1